MHFNLPTYSGDCPELWTENPYCDRLVPIYFHLFWNVGSTLAAVSTHFRDLSPWYRCGIGDNNQLFTCRLFSRNELCTCGPLKLVFFHNTQTLTFMASNRHEYIDLQTDLHYFLHPLCKFGWFWMHFNLPTYSGVCLELCTENPYCDRLVQIYFHLFWNVGSTLAAVSTHFRHPRPWYRCGYRWQQPAFHL